MGKIFEKVIVEEYMQLIAGELYSVNNKYYSIHHSTKTNIKHLDDGVFYYYECTGYKGLIRRIGCTLQYFSECEPAGILLSKVLSTCYNHSDFYFDTLLDSAYYLFCQGEMDSELHDIITDEIFNKRAGKGKEV